jgi:hypothetical protein
MPQSYSEFRKENYTKPAIVSPLFLLLILYFIVNERRYQTVSSLALPLLTQKVSCLNLGLEQIYLETGYPQDFEIFLTSILGQQYFNIGHGHFLPRVFQFTINIDAK